MTAAAVQAVTASTGTVTLNASAYGAVVLTLTGSGVTVALSGGAAGTEASIVLYVTQGSGGPYTLTWPAVTWAGGTAPALGGGTSIFTFASPDGGVTWYGAEITAAPPLPLSVSSGGTGLASAGAAGTFPVSTGLTTALTYRAIVAGDIPLLNQPTTGTAGNITATLDQVPAPAADVSLAGRKATSLANGTASTDAAAFGQIQAKLAATSLTGVPLINGTGVIVSWTAPNDGAMHRVSLAAEMRVTTAETGGAIVITHTLPDGTTGPTKTVFAAGQAVNVYFPTNQSCPTSFLIAPNSTIAVTQTSALTAGAATVWAELWGS